MSSPRSPWRQRALVQLTLQRCRDFVREPEALFWGLVFPVLLAVGLGVAFRNQPASPTRVGAVSVELATVLRREPLLIVEDVDERDPAAARRALESGAVTLVAERTAEGVVYHYDDTNPEARVARILADRAVQRAGGRVDPVQATDDVAVEVGARYIDFLIPGLVGMGIMGNAIWGLGFSIVDTRRRKLMKRMVATPMRRLDYLLSFLLWRLLLLAVEVGVPVGFGALVFGVPVRGSLVQLVLLCVLGSLAMSAVGLLVASRVKTIEAVSGLTNIVMMPMWILSGVFFSSQRFPDAVQPFIKALPLTALIDALRANMLRGTGLGQLLPQVAVLGTCLVVCFTLALKLFRWR